MYPEASFARKQCSFQAHSSKKVLQTLKNHMDPSHIQPILGWFATCQIALALRQNCTRFAAICTHVAGFHPWHKKTAVTCSFHHQNMLRHSKKCSFPWFARKTSATMCYQLNVQDYLAKNIKLPGFLSLSSTESRSFDHTASRSLDHLAC